MDYQAYEKEMRSRDVVRNLQVKAALKGGAVSRYQAGFKWSPYCDNPQRMFRGSERNWDMVSEVWIDGLPCRRCEKCLRFRALRWRDRMGLEMLRAKRTWFGTITFAPEHLAGIIFESMGSKHADRERAIDDAAYRHLQRYFKRLRKGGNRFRYFACFELGEKTGRPHYHVLIHELGPRPIFQKTLDEQWRSFTMFSLVRNSRASANYVSKYLTKSFSVRPRASQSYGSHKSDA